MNQFYNNLQNVTDPSDWKSTKIPDLSQLDSLQRCFICKEFLKAPVITGCNHTFCSRCIREYLVTNSHCPLCQTEQFESNLKRVILLEEIVSCFNSFRPLLLQLLKEDSTSENLESNSSNVSILDRKRPFQNEDSEIIEIVSDSDTSQELIVKKAKTEVPNQKYEMDAIPSREENVSCPICSQKMTADILQATHIDECLNGKSSSTKTNNVKLQSHKKKPSPKLGISSFFQSTKSSNNGNIRESKSKVDYENFYFNEASSHHHDEVKRLPKLDFSSLTTPKLKEKLSAIKLPSQGTRHQLELRYNQYHILFNSNLDSNHPIPEKLLKQKLNQWELSHLAFNSSSLSLFSSRSSLSNKSITDKDFLVKLWKDTYKDEFKELVRSAKKFLKHSETTKSKTSITNEAPINDPYVADPGIHSDSENAYTTNDTVCSETAPESAVTNNKPDNLMFDIEESPLFASEKKV